MTLRSAADGDRDAVLALGVAEEAAWFGDVGIISAEEVGEWIGEEGGVTRGAVAVDDGGRVRGFASPGRHDTVLLADPALTEPLADELLAWLHQQPDVIKSMTFAGDAARVALFERHGLRHCRSSSPWRALSAPGRCRRRRSPTGSASPRTASVTPTTPSTGSFTSMPRGIGRGTRRARPRRVAETCLLHQREAGVLLRDSCALGHRPVQASRRRRWDACVSRKGAQSPGSAPRCSMSSKAEALHGAKDTPGEFTPASPSRTKNPSRTADGLASASRRRAFMERGDPAEQRPVQSLRVTLRVAQLVASSPASPAPTRGGASTACTSTRSRAASPSTMNPSSSGPASTSPCHDVAVGAGS
ncbi:MAG: hypothetical protein QOC60_1579 [Frankiaceae bacterium]|nr:hypothetical protein [Frankiaceae bacterium]